MKIELSENKVFFENDGSKKEIHPFWLRERVNGDQYVDQGTQQRLFDPTELKNNIKINKLLILDDFLEVTFDDGAFAKIAIQSILKEFVDDNDIKLIQKIKWNSSLKDFNYFQFNENFFENKSMFDALIKFYQYGFVIFKNVPTENNFLVKFANSIGSIRRTNFGEYFDVKSKPNPNDLAYTSLPLAPHTDNPYRNPVPCIQILHCIENEVSGGFSTLVDGYTVTEELKKNYKDFNYFQFNENFFEHKSMFDALIKFYQYGFVIFKNVPTENNFLVKFANSIGSIRRTNFGEYFDVKSKPNPNDLAYTSLPLAPHTDNPYRNPVPCIQILHCIENEVSGGFSTLVDGYTVTEELKKNYKEYYEVLTKTKIRFQFIDDSVVLESWAEMIQLDEYKKFKQVRFSPRLDFVPLMDRDKLELYYSARNKISELYNSDQYRIEFKLSPGDLLMMDNHRLLHGRTTYDANEGNRFLQGCYIDYDSTEGKLKHLQRKFNN